MAKIERDSFILVYRDKRKKWLVRPSETPKLHTHLGILDCMSLVGREYGIRVITSLNDELIVMKPTLEDIVMKFSRRTQVIYPKDLATIILKCGVHSGSRVFEAGTGSGSATAAMAYTVAPEGHVFSYDINGEFQANAKRNLEKFGLATHVTLKNQDAKLGVEERDLDAALIDMGDPWELVKPVRDALAPSGIVAGICPTMNQAEKLVQTLHDNSFAMTETLEIISRNIEARTGMTRPSMFMVGHTAYLVFGRKLQ
ncbi:MAG: tRNA (adenine-N1)-methyltransferase [Thaumarchaeota archaeon]|nr:tRNA (adenine-N1)-methyltransferase [Nitrososphaerota archaeon]